ncbi:MAG: Helix-turn-helix domain [Rickettsiaceae bacterium]|jgi:transcriptional regulator with XRE-family HTH domain|nr:Helix-turn-helix domain [Rickettsiaceae bacterium]
MTGMLGDRLKEFMLSNNLTIEDVHKKVGLDVNTIKNILYGKSKKTDYFEMIAQAYGLPIAYFTKPSSPVFPLDNLDYVMTLVLDAFKERNIHYCFLEFFNSLFVNTASLKRDGCTDSELKLYVKGNIDAAIRFNIIKPS